MFVTFFTVYTDRFVFRDKCKNACVIDVCIFLRVQLSKYSMDLTPWWFQVFNDLSNQFDRIGY